jgi:hypothetical protein
MAAAGLADVIDVRVMMLGSAVLTGDEALVVLPGLRPAAANGSAMSLLRAAPAGSGLGVGAPRRWPISTPCRRLPSLSGLSAKSPGAHRAGV